MNSLFTQMSLSLTNLEHPYRGFFTCDGLYISISIDLRFTRIWVGDQGAFDILVSKEATEMIKCC